MIKCPYPKCPFEADNEDAIDDHVITMGRMDDPDHREQDRR